MNLILNNSISPVIAETFLRLRRDRIFLPAAIVGILMIFLAGLASYWGIEEFFKILYDLGTTVFHLTGVIVAIFWGTKLIHDSKQEGSVEVQLAAPIRRTDWLLGKYLGLSCALLLLALILLGGWQLVYLYYGMGWIGWGSVTIFATLSLSWLVMASVTILLATFSSQAVALFAAFWLLICGLLTQPVLQSLAPETPAAIRTLVTWFAGLWDLHYFNLGVMVGERLVYPELSLFVDRLFYAGALITATMAMACISFSRRDVIG